MRVSCTLLALAVCLVGATALEQDTGYSITLQAKNTLAPSSDGKARTEFVYALTIAADEMDLDHWVLGALNCPSMYTVETGQGSSFGSYGADEATGYFGGFKNSGSVVNSGNGGVAQTFSLVALSRDANPVSSSDVLYAVASDVHFQKNQYVEGPTCEALVTPSCSIAGVSATCSGGGVYHANLVPEVAGAEKFSWTDASGTFSDAQAPALSFESTSCGGTKDVSLTVTNFNAGGDEDLEDRSSTCSAVVSYGDSFVPVFSSWALIGDYAAEAGDVAAVPVINAGHFDDCNTVTVVFSDTQSSEVAPYTLTRTWTATDACDLATTVTQEVSVTDTTAPDLTGVDDDEEAECDVVPPPCEVVASDLSDGDVLVAYSETRIDGGCTNAYTLVRTWTAEDPSGNEHSQTQTITVLDNTAPVFLNAIPADVSVDCDQIPPAAVLTARDGCSGDVSVLFDQKKVDDQVSSPHSYQLIRTWSAVDACGNKVTGVQTVTVSDSSPPVLTSPDADTTVECDLPTSPCVVEASDNCDGSVDTILTTETLDATCENSFTTTYTWTSTDSSGNSDSVSQTVTTIDDTPPALHGLPSQVESTVECDDIPDPMVTDSDNCGASTLVDSGNVIQLPKTNEATYTIIRTWTSTDVCGNTEHASRTFHVVDTTNPILKNFPSDMTAPCSDIPDAPTVGVTDNCCVGATVDFLENTEDGSCDNEYLMKRTWWIQDCAGNPTQGTQSIQITDTTPPTFQNLQGDVTISFEAWGSLVETVTASDDCGPATLTHTEDTIDGTCLQQFTVVRSWSATDLCGNTTPYTRTIEVEDVDPPTLTPRPQSTEVDCAEIPSTPLVSASDVQDPLVDVNSVEYTTQTIPDGPCNSKIIRDWFVSDDCGNTDSHSQTISVTDTTAPSFIGTLPEDADYDLCTGDAPLTPPTVNGQDDCGHATVSVVATSSETDCQTTLKHVYSIEDECGSTGTPHTQFVTITDSSDPVFDLPVPIDDTVQCYANVPAAPTVTATKCEESGVEVTGSVPQDDFTQCGQLVVRMWVASDICGNVQPLTQTITVDDTTDPVLTPVDASQELECKATPVLPTVTGTDNCVESVQVQGPISAASPKGSDDPDGFIEATVYTWSAVDTCNNDAEETQRIVWVDTTPPTVSVPGDDDAPCHDVPDTGLASANDVCGPVTQEVTTVKHDGTCDGAYILVNTWTVTDAVGLTATDSQTVRVTDNEPPVITYPEDWVSEFSLECDEDVPEEPEVTAVDLCGDVTLTYDDSEIVSLEGSAPSDYDIVRTWTFTDECGNESTATQTVQVRDTTPPTITDQVDGYHEFDAQCEAPEAPTPEVDDNCDLTISLDFTSLTVSEGPCKLVTKYTWTSQDASGNDAIPEQILVTTIDTTDPEWVESTLPQKESTYQHSDAVPFTEETLPTFNPQATDSCGVTVEQTYTEAPGCSDYAFVRSYVATASDTCGNDIEYDWTVTVEDVRVPSFLDVPDDSSQPCSDAAPTAATVTSNDGTVTAAPALPQYANDVCDDSYDVTFGYLVTNVCGKTDTAEYTVTVTNEGPTIADVPDATAQCTLATPDPPPVDDDCSTVTVSGPTKKDIELQTDFDLPYATEFTWTTQDSCGEPAETSATVTVLDEEDPVLVNVPGDLTIPYIEVPPGVIVTYTDNCEAELTFEETKIDGTCLYAYMMVRTWTVTDYAGNSVTESQTIETSDSVAPTLSPRPEDQTLDFATLDEVSDDAPYGIPLQNPAVTATDNLDPTLVVEYTEVKTPGATDEEFTVTRTWTVEDACGNADIVVQIITIIHEPPYFELFGFTIECDADVPTTIEEDTIALQARFDDETDEFYNDNGVIVTNAPEEKVDGTCDNYYQIVRSFTATDDVGNSEPGSYTINVIDTTPPELSEPLPEDQVYSCVLGPADPVLATDNCVGVNDVDYTQTVENGITYRTWTVTDACGHTDSHTIVVSIKDTELPVFVESPLPADATSLCVKDEPAVLTATDNCGPVEVIYSETPITGECLGRLGVVVRTWKVTDSSTNFEVHTQTLTVVDTDAPVFAPESLVFEANQQCSKNWPTPKATDNCLLGDILVTHTDGEATVDGHQTTYTRTYSTTDGCNPNTWVATLVVEDTTPPTMLEPVDVTEECGGVVPDIFPVADDDCGVATVSKETTVEITDCAVITTTVYTATDEVDLTFSVDRVVTIEDTQAPTIAWTTQPAGNECALPEAPTATGTDCSAFTVEVSQNPIVDGSCTGEYTVTWTATAVDECGKEADSIVSDVANVVDTTVPTFNSQPSSSSHHQCIIPDAEVLTADDACSSATVDYTAETNTEGCVTTEARTWTATDECGNTATVTSTITVEDITPPTISPEDDITVECGTTPPVPQYTGSDNCNGDVTIVKTVDNLGTVPGSYTQTYQATDACGLTATDDYTITVTDTKDPTVTIDPHTTEFECGESAQPTASATDICDPNIGVPDMERNEFDKTCPHTYEVEYIFTATDASGNKDIATTTISVSDNAPPTWDSDLPADTTVDCIPGPYETLSATDNCDETLQVPAYSQLPESLNGLAGVVVRTWATVDSCGHPLVHRQTITVVDDEAPVLDHSIDWDGECDEDPHYTVSSTDNCDANPSSEWSVGDIVTGTCAEAWSLTVTYTATDKNGQKSSSTSTSTWSDNTAPVITVSPPGDVTKECVMPVAPTVEVTDNCDETVVVVPDFQPVGCAHDFSGLQTWTATDVCGNVASESRSVTVTDDVGPTITFSQDFQATLSAECNEVPGRPAVISVSDNCAAVCADCTVTDVDDVVDDGSCDDQYTLTRAWKVVDVCGNDTPYTQVISVSDTTPPTLTASNDQDLECGETQAPVTATASDNCTTDPTIEETEERTSGECGTEVTVHTFSTTDDCGLTATDTVTVTITDTTPPTWVGTPETSLTADCDAVPVRSDDDTRAIDTCCDATVVCVEVVDPGTCDQQYTITRTCTASDPTGNTVTTVLVIEIVDTSAPELSGVPSDGLNSLILDGSDANVYAVDNCDPNPSVEVAVETTGGTCDGESTTVLTWTATDDCGNVSTDTATIEQTDTEPCVFTETPDDVTAECDSIPATCEVICVDPADGDVDFTTSQVGNKITRSWSHTDPCGNTASHSQVVTIVDTTAPVLSREPEDQTVTCDCDSFPLAPTVYALDNCNDDVQVDFTEEKFGGDNTDNYKLVRTWTATDNEAVPVSHSQTITVTDNEGPVIPFSGETELFAPCYDISTGEDLGAYDNCDSSVSIATVSQSASDQTSDCANDSLTRTWTSTDRSGNTNTVVQTITVADENGPTFTPAETSVCLKNNGMYKVFPDAANYFFPSVVDDCSGDSNTIAITVCVSTIGEVEDCQYSEGNDNLYIKGEAPVGTERIYRLHAKLTDACGNFRDVSVSINVPAADDSGCISPSISSLSAL